ncbi:MAG: cytochrome c family protein [Candidatus Saccharibacteria bacterium]|nr:cytochrome c family protein [Pseudorhodobacter sp.]
MFDTMTLTKLVGGVCGALLIFLFGAWASQAVYGLGEGAHEETTLAYSVAGAEVEGAATAEAAAEPEFSVIFASADATAGEKVFGKCKSCHKVDGSNGTGPHLNGVVGRGHAEVADFKYSDAMAAHKGEPWTPEAMYAFLQNPKGVIAGTKMAFAGLSKPEDRANVIAYLATLD